MSLGIILAKITLWGLGGVILVLCGVMCGFWPIILNYQLRQELMLTNDSKSYDLWKDTPIPMYLEIYMFNWTNPEESLGINKTKPNFHQLGPYVFSEHHKKEKLVWNSNNTITYKQRRQWQFIPSRSNGSLSDNITNINVVALFIGKMVVNRIPQKLLPIANSIIKHEEQNMYVTKTVDELLFKGYYDKILNITKKLEKLIKIKIPFDKFGWFYNRNNSLDYDGVMNMKTGSSSLKELGDIVQWNYNSTTPSYRGQCGKVDGTSGELWPVNSASKHHIKIFVTDICSSLTLKREGTKTVNNVKGSRFIVDETVFDNGDKVPNNDCYCTKKPCTPTGARDISACRYGAPAFISLPHFYEADEAFTENVTGMTPSPGEHSFYMVLEQVTSIPLEVHARLQINIRSEPIKELKFYENLPYAYMPMVWFDESAVVTPSLASELSSLVGVATYVEPSLISFTIIGAIMIIIGLALWRLKYFSSTSRDELLISPNDSS